MPPPSVTSSPVRNTPTTSLKQIYGSNVTSGAQIALESSRLYYTEGRDSGSVISLTETGDASILADNQQRPTFLLAYGGRVVFVNQSDPGAANGTVAYVDTANPGSARTRIRDLAPITGLVRWGKWAYFALGTQGAIGAFSLETFDRVSVVEGLAEVDQLAVDGDDLYFSGNPSGSPHGIYRVRRCGGPVLPFTGDTRGRVTSLVIEGAYVYWIAAGTTYTLRRVTR